MIKEQQKKLILPKGVFIKYTLETYPPIYVLSNGKKIKGILNSLSISRLATISETIFNVPSITIAEINHDVFV